MRKKFTLIELLVVVAIIGILAAMILPALGKARQKAKEAKCKSRLKNIGTSVGAYFSDGTLLTFPTGWLDNPPTIDIDDNLITCAVLDQDIYVRHADSPDGGTYTGFTGSGLAQDPANAHESGTSNTVYQDGAVR